MDDNKKEKYMNRYLLEREIAIDCGCTNLMSFE